VSQGFTESTAEEAALAWFEGADWSARDGTGIEAGKLAIQACTL